MKFLKIKQKNMLQLIVCAFLMLFMSVQNMQAQKANTNIEEVSSVVANAKEEIANRVETFGSEAADAVDGTTGHATARMKTFFYSYLQDQTQQGVSLNSATYSAYEVTMTKFSDMGQEIRDLYITVQEDFELN